MTMALFAGHNPCAHARGYLHRKNITKVEGRAIWEGLGKDASGKSRLSSSSQVTKSSAKDAVDWLDPKRTSRWHDA